jgi:carbon-monoxide dehydrogenase small subunit
MKLAFTVNGKRRAYTGSGMKRLLDVLREDMALPGTKEGCGEGECGACTVLLDGEAVVSCLVPVAQLAGRRVATVESLGRPGRLSPLQEAFLDEGAAQCGICTPGMLMTASAYLRQGGSPAAAEIRRALAGNLCRCTGYQHIVRAVQRAARRRSRTRK